MDNFIGYGEVILFWCFVIFFGFLHQTGYFLPNTRPRIFWYSLFIISGVTAYYLYPFVERLF